MLLSVNSSTTDDTFYVAVSVICEFCCVNLCSQLYCAVHGCMSSEMKDFGVGLVDGRGVYRLGWTFLSLHTAYGVGWGPMQVCINVPSNTDVKPRSIIPQLCLQ